MFNAENTTKDEFDELYEKCIEEKDDFNEVFDEDEDEDCEDEEEEEDDDEIFENVKMLMNRIQKNIKLTVFDRQELLVYLQDYLSIKKNEY